MAEQCRQSILKSVRKRVRQRAVDKQTLAVLDALPADVAVLDAAGVILAVNAAWRRSAEANGYAGSSHGVGTKYLEVYRQMADADDVRAAEQAICSVLGQAQAEHCFEYRSPGADTERRFFFRAVRLKDAGPICVMISHEEITYPKQAEARARRLEAARDPAQTSAQATHWQAEAALRDHSARLSILHEIDQTILAAGSLKEAARAVLQIIYRLIPYWRASVLVYDFDLNEYQVAAVCQNGVSSEPPMRRSQIAELTNSEMFVAVLRRGENYAYDLRQLVASWPEAAALLADGMRYQICIPLIAQGELFGSVQVTAPTQESFDSTCMPIIREILDSLAIGVRQARLFEQIQDGRERQHDLARRLVAAQEQERRQIARELHDRIGQNLAVLNMNLANTRKQLSRESAKRVDGRLADAIELVDQTIEQIRNVMADLRPAILDDFGLVAALRWYIRYFARHTDLVVLLEIEEPPGGPRLAPDLETALFRIAQEALTNVLKHARATQATLALTTIGSIIRLVIADDGVGFKPSALPRPTRRWSLGLMTMQERVEAVGGRLVVDSAPGQGTRIIAEVAREEYGDRGLSGR